MFRCLNENNEWIYSENNDFGKGFYHSTITRSTGFKDIEGKDIYEGDIVTDDKVSGGVMFKNNEPVVEVCILKNKNCDWNKDQDLIEEGFCSYITLDFKYVELNESFKIVGNMTMDMYDYFKEMGSEVDI